MIANCSPENKLDYLCVGDQPFPVGSPAKGTKEIVEVHEDMDEGVGQEGDLLQ